MVALATTAKASWYCLVKAAALALRSICCGHSVAVAVAVTFHCTYTHANDNSNHGSIDGCFLTFFLSVVAFDAAEIVTLLLVCCHHCCLPMLSPSLLVYCYFWNDLQLALLSPLLHCGNLDATSTVVIAVATGLLLLFIYTRHLLSLLCANDKATSTAIASIDNGWLLPVHPPPGSPVASLL